MFTPASGESGIVDTGTTLMLLADDTVDSYYANTGATYDDSQGGYIYPCSTTLPDFSIQIEGYTATVPGSDIAFAQVDDTNCFGGIQSRGSNPFSIYGDVFLKSQYVVFDQRNGGPQVAFAPKA
jgi:aspergillopepsin I